MGNEKDLTDKLSVEEIKEIRQYLRYAKDIAKKANNRFYSNYCFYPARN